MNIHVFKLDQNSFVKPGILSVERVAHQSENCLYLNTLQLSNLKTTGPTKKWEAGLFNIPLVRYGSSISIDIKDALGDLNSLQTFFGFKNVEDDTYSYVYKGNSHSSPLALEGELKIMNAITKEINTVYLFIPCFVPNGNLEIIADSASNLGVFDLSGTIYPMKVTTLAKDAEGNVDIYKHNQVSVQYYSISAKSIFDTPKDFALQDEDIVIIECVPYVYNFETGDYIYNEDAIIIDASASNKEGKPSNFIKNKDAVQLIIEIPYKEAVFGILDELVLE